MADWWSTSMDANNWDLYAVVRGRCFSSPTTPATVNPFSSFPTPLLKEESVSGEEDPISFPDLTATEKALHGLEELYKPFFPKPQQHLLLSPQRSSPSPSSSAPVADLQDSAVAGPHQTREMRQPYRSLPHTPRSKRRKNQQKKVVCQVPADGLSSDMWAWRKYGQKPIKGSPYPRGYYRCSSSKGCLARKQVERSRTDPAMLVITYTAEHNHPVPTHRNSLAGTTRNKFPPPSSGGGGDGEHCLPVNNPSFSPLSLSNAAGLSPTTPLTASVEDELLQRRRPLKGEIEDDEDNEEEEGGPVTMGGMVGEDDMIFMELEELAAPLTVAVNTPAAAFSIDSAFCDGDDDLAVHFFSTRWQVNNSAVAGASGS